MILARIICLLIACGHICSAKTDAYVGPTTDISIYDFVFGCMVEYSEKLFTALNQGFTTKEQIYEECNLYKEFQGCLSQKSGDTYIQMFIAGLGEAMDFCECLVDLQEFLKLPEVNPTTTSNIVCKLYGEQADCLQAHFYGNPFVKHLITDLNTELDSDYCKPMPILETFPATTPHITTTLPITPSKEWSTPAQTTPGPTPTKGTGPTTTSPEHPGEVRHPCFNIAHPTSKKCSVWLHDNYHTAVYPGWAACSKWTSRGYGRPCGYWWAKCKKLGKNSHCCISAHCYGYK